MNQEEFDAMVATLEQENRQLRARNERLQAEQLMKQEPSLKAEPVAWQWLDTANFRKKLSENANKDEWKPLYTASPSEVGFAPKQLSDEEIHEIRFQHGWGEVGKQHLLEFARAILKKASEK